MDCPDTTKKGHEVSLVAQYSNAPMREHPYSDGYFVTTNHPEDKEICVHPLWSHMTASLDIFDYPNPSTKGEPGPSRATTESHPGGEAGGKPRPTLTTSQTVVNGKPNLKSS